MKAEPTVVPASLAKDKDYNLVSVLQESLHQVWQMDIYASDAEREGDTELAEWFRAVERNNRKAAEQAKELLKPRWDSGGSTEHGHA